MAHTTRIPEAVIERLKREIELAELVARAGVTLRAHGDNLLGLCPFHNDSNPSFVVTKSKNLFHCLGCGAAGSVIDWVMKYEKVGFRRAVEILRPQLPSLVAGLAASEVAQAQAIDLNADDQRLLNDVVTYYTRSIEEGWQYLASRGLDDTEMVKHFHIGFCNRSLGYHLPLGQLKAGREIRARLTTIGLIRESGYEHFAGSLTIPVFDEAGNVTEVYGRKITSRLREGTPLHLYLKGQHRGVWNWSGLIDQQEVILSEALIDGLTFWRAGFHNVTASYGVNGFTDDHLAIFQRYGIKRVLIAYDRDEAGDRAARELAEQLTAVGINCYRIEFPAGMDANEYAQELSAKEQIAAAFTTLIKQAVPMRGALPLSADEAQPQPIIEISTPPSITTTNETTHKSDTITAQALAGDVAIERRGDAVIMQMGDRLYRVYNLEHNTSYGQLKINLLCARNEQFHMDTLDLSLHKERKNFWQRAAEELAIKEEIIKADLGRVLFKLEELQDELIKKAITPQEPTITMTTTEREAAWAFLTAPGLLERIIADYQQCGIVGEENNTLLGYLAATSRLLDDPLAVIIQSSSAAGKSSLMEAVLDLMPAEQRVKYSAMTGQSLYYLGQKDLKHKIVAIVEQEGAQNISYPLKILQSEGELTIASTGKDANTGRLVTHEYRVEGPVMIFITTTAIEIDPELINRCLVLTVNESREQTRAIHKLQRERETLAGLFAADRRKEIIKLHQNAQRLLRSINVVNPYANELTFLDDQTRTRRDHTKYLKLIRTIALLHQYQRPIKTARLAGQSKQYIEVTLDDIEVANELVNEVLGRTLDDLPPQTKRFLLLLEEMVKAKCEQLQVKQQDYRFTGREVREKLGWSYDQVRVHMERLVQLEYVITHRGGRGQQFVYELIYDGKGKEGEKFLIGLIDVNELRAREDQGMTQSLGGKNEGLGGSLGRHWGGIGASLGSSENAISASIHAPALAIDGEIVKNAYIGENGNALHHNHTDRSEQGGE